MLIIDIKINAKVEREDIMNEPSLVYLRPKTAAKYLDISIATFWRLVAKGKIPTTKISARTTLCKREDLDALIDSSQ